jgi:hypothetical protein
MKRSKNSESGSGLQAGPPATTRDKVLYGLLPLQEHPPISCIRRMVEKLISYCRE